MPRVTLFRSFCFVLLLLGGVYLGMRHEAWSNDKGTPVDISLEVLTNNPEAYVGKDVRILCRFSMLGKLYRREASAFSRAAHQNFAVWPVDALLWQPESRQRVVPSVYLQRSNPQMRVLRGLSRYEAVEITARVRSAYARMPWLAVYEINPVRGAAYNIDDEGLEKMRLGMALLAKKEYQSAQRPLAEARASVLPKMYHQRIDAALNLCAAHAPTKTAPQIVSDEARMPAVPVEKVAAHPQRMQRTRPAPAPIIEDIHQPRAPIAQSSTENRMPETEVSPKPKAVAPTATVSVEELAKVEAVPVVPDENAVRQAMDKVRAARAAVMMNRYADAARAYAKAIAPSSPLCRAGWLRKEIGRLYESRYDVAGDIGNLRIAHREYGKAQRIAEAADHEAAFLLARATGKLAMHGEATLDDAEAILEQSLALSPSMLTAQLLQARFAAEQGRYDAAEARLKKLYGETALPAAGCMVQGLVAEGRGDIDSAIHAYRYAVAIDPEMREAWERIGRLAFAAERPEASEEAYTKLIRLRPGHIPYRISLGKAYVQGGQYAEAAEVLQFAPTVAGAVGQEARALLAQCEMRLAQEGTAAMHPPAGNDVPKTGVILKAPKAPTPHVMPKALEPTSAAPTNTDAVRPSPNADLPAWAR